jgi:O-acetylserine/cysteine efflux transporter
MARRGEAMSLSQVTCAVLVPLVWGCQYSAIKVGMSAFPPLFFLGLRFILIAAILLPFVGRTTKNEFRYFVVISLFIGGLNFGLVFVGLKATPASVAGIATSCGRLSRCSSLGPL